MLSQHDHATHSLLAEDEVLDAAARAIRGERLWPMWLQMYHLLGTPHGVDADLPLLGPGIHTYRGVLWQLGLTALKDAFEEAMRGIAALIMTLDKGYCGTIVILARGMMTDLCRSAASRFKGTARTVWAMAFPCSR